MFVVLYRQEPQIAAMPMADGAGHQFKALEKKTQTLQLNFLVKNKTRLGRARLGQFQPYSYLRSIIDQVQGLFRLG